MAGGKGVALVTGASSGIGAVYADRLAKRGYALLLVARDETRLAALADRLRAETGVSIETLKADLNTADDLRGVEARLASDETISMLVNNAGVAAVTPLIHSDVEQLDAMVRLNVLAATRLAAAAASAFAARGSGTIVNIASTAGVRGTSTAHAYAASKGGVMALTKAMASSFGPQGIRVNAIAPGTFTTDMVTKAYDDAMLGRIASMSALGRNGDPDELVGPALLLASDAGSFHTGVVLTVDAGATC